MKYQSLLIQAIFNQRNTISKTASETASAQSLQTSINALSVYRNNYTENGIRALSISYASVFAVMDEADFRKLCTAYLQNHPKTCFDWADYGENLSEFMLTIDALTSMPFLPELADIDWRLMHIERSPNDTFNAASFGLLQTCSLDSLCFVPAPGLQLAKVLFPIPELYQLARNDSNSTLPDAEQDLQEHQELQEHQARQQKQEHQEHQEQQQHQGNKVSANKIKELINAAIKTPTFRSIILWREEYKGVFEYCDLASAKAFDAIINKNSISDVLNHFGDDQNAITQWLQQHIQSKKIYAVVEKFSIDPVQVDADFTQHFYTTFIKAENFNVVASKPSRFLLLFTAVKIRTC